MTPRDVSVHCGPATDLVDDAPELRRAIGVLRMSTGEVGWDELDDADGGTYAERHLRAPLRVVGAGVRIELVNRPSWSRMPGLHTSNRWRFVTCTLPAPEVVADLEALARNARQRTMNAVRTRNGQPAHELERTRFEDWVAPDEKIRASAALWLLRSSESVAIWFGGVWGLACAVLAHDDAAAAAPFEQAAARIGVPLRRVATERELPCW